MNRTARFRRILPGVLALAAALALAGCGGGDSQRVAYRYTDDAGVVHVTDELNNVPRKHRGSVEILNMENRGNYVQAAASKVKQSMGSFMQWLGFGDEPDPERPAAPQPRRERDQDPHVGDGPGWFEKDGDSRFDR